MSPLAALPTTPPSGGGGTTINFPSVDLTKVVPDLVEPFLAKVLQVLADALEAAWNGLIGSGVNVLTRTAPEWLYTQPDVVRLQSDLMPALNGITLLAVVIAGIGLVGREFWGFSWEPVEAAAKIAMGVVYGSAALRLCAWSVDLVDHINDGLGGVTLAHPPQVLITGSVADTMVSAGLAIVWFVVGLLLLLLMAERLAMLVLLFIISPVALGVWGIPQARSYSGTWARLWFGWLVGQPLALICLKLASVMAGLFGGGSMAILMGIALLLIARQAALLFVGGGTSDWGGQLARVGTSLAMRGKR